MIEVNSWYTTIIWNVDNTDDNWQNNVYAASSVACGSIIEQAVPSCSYILPSSYFFCYYCLIHVAIKVQREVLCPCLLY